MIAIFLDLETTGLDPYTHRTLEVAFKFVDLSSGKVLMEYSSRVKQPPEVWEKRDHMSVQINGFRFEDLVDGKTEEEISKDIHEIFEKYEIKRGRAFYICQNPAFDRNYFSQIIPIYSQEKLSWPYHWLDFASMYWALRVKQNALGIEVPMSASSNPIFLSKDSIAEQFQLPKETKPHRAMNGVDHLILCYENVVGWGEGS